MPLIVIEPGLTRPDPNNVIMTLPSNYRNHKQHQILKTQMRKRRKRIHQRAKLELRLSFRTKLLTTYLQNRDFFVGNGKLNQKNTKQTNEKI